MPRLLFEHHAGPSGTRRSCVLENLPGEHFILEEPIWIEIPGLSLPEPAVWDGFLFAILLRLMEIGACVRIEGSISRQALRNAMELEDVWSLWCPDRYRRVTLEPENIVDCLPRPGTDAICAFSGGADSIFSLLRHRLRWLGEASLPVGMALMVHGFDVLLSDKHSFHLLVKRCEPLLKELGIPLQIARTNLKTASRQHWEYSFAAQLAGCLHQFADVYSGGIIGSSESYDSQVFPLGSTPMTDPLLSGGAFSIFHDGAGYSRTGKLERITHHETALRVLKVCWEGPRADENCGTCEKCIRTQLNLLAVGLSQAPCFSAPLAFNAIRTVSIGSPAQFSELLSIYNYSRQKGIQAEWVPILRARLDRYRRDARLGRYKERLRHLLGNTHPAWRLARWLKRGLSGAMS